MRTIENKNEVNKDLEKALQTLEQAKQHAANEKRNRTRKIGKPRTTTKALWVGLSPNQGGKQRFSY